MSYSYCLFLIGCFLVYITVKIITIIMYKLHICSFQVNEKDVSRRLYCNLILES